MGVRPRDELAGRLDLPVLVDNVGNLGALAEVTWGAGQGAQVAVYINNYNYTRPYRLVFAFHWLGGTATDAATGRTVLAGVWSYYGLQRLSNNSTIFVAPQGINNGWANTNGRDLTFVDDMLRQFESVGEGPANLPSRPDVAVLHPVLSHAAVRGAERCACPPRRAPHSQRPLGLAGLIYGPSAIRPVSP